MLFSDYFLFNLDSVQKFCIFSIKCRQQLVTAFEKICRCLSHVQKARGGPGGQEFSRNWLHCFDRLQLFLSNVFVANISIMFSSSQEFEMGGTKYYN